MVAINTYTWQLASDFKIRSDRIKLVLRANSSPPSEMKVFSTCELDVKHDI
jgi:hypothetical protein